MYVTILQRHGREPYLWLNPNPEESLRDAMIMLASTMMNKIVRICDDNINESETPSAMQLDPCPST